MDGVVCGHIHTAETRQFGDITYYNDGDWVEGCTALVEHYDGRIEILHRSEEHTSELQSLMRISYAVFCLKKKTKTQNKYSITLSIPIHDTKHNKRIHKI